MGTENSYIEVLGSRIRTKQIRCKKSDHVPTIVLLHDALGSIEQWKDFPEKLAKETTCHILVYDRPGHGLSDSVIDENIEKMFDREALHVLPELLEKLKINNPILYGHSDGGTIALIYAAHIKCAGLILEAAHVLVEKITREGVLKTAKERNNIVPKLEKYHGSKAASLFDKWARLWSGEIMKNWNIIHLLNRIDVQICIIQGCDDNYGSEEQVKSIAQEAEGPSSVHMIKDCGHVPHKEKTIIVLSHIQQFLRNQLKLTHNEC